MDKQIIPVSQRVTAINNAIELWVKSKSNSSKSKRTQDTYKEYITSFRSSLQFAGIDLDGMPLTDEYAQLGQEEILQRIALAAQGWASRAEKPKQIQEGVSASTYNQRLSILSSFYTFAKKRGFLRMDNPIGLVDRHKTQEYASARPIPKEYVASALRAIDRSTLAGKRDYALVLLFLNTGRRASEVLAMKWKDIQMREKGMTIHFLCKGNKNMYDTVEPRVYKAIMEYLYALFGSDLGLIDPLQPIWLSLSHKRLMQPLTQRGLADIFQSRLKTTKIHAMRHTFAHNMAKTGASVMDIQARLGHSNVATTGRYLQQLNSDENKYASDLLDLFEVEE